MKRKTARYVPTTEGYYESLPSSVSDSGTDYDELPMSAQLNQGFNRDLDFSDSSPWNETLKDEEETGTEPSFSTPAKPEIPEVSAPTKLMAKIFKPQIEKNNEKNLQKEREKEKEQQEIEDLKNQLKNQSSELKVSNKNSTSYLVFPELQLKF